jgi:hypothetical protein
MSARQIRENVGSYIKTINFPIESDTNDTLAIHPTPPTQMSSYNWTYTRPGIQPTIMVPGNTHQILE